MIELQQIDKLLGSELLTGDNLEFIKSLRERIVKYGENSFISENQYKYYDGILFNHFTIFEQSISIDVTEEIKRKAKEQVKEFEQTQKGSYRYKGVKAWRGVACEFIASDWLTKNFDVEEEAKGLDTSGKYDEQDMIINKKKIEIKSATCFGYGHIMPKAALEQEKKKDIYIGVKYNELIEPNQILIVGFMEGSKVINYPQEQNKGVPYYKVPISDLIPIKKLREYLGS